MTDDERVHECCRCGVGLEWPPLDFESKTDICARCAEKAQAMTGEIPRLKRVAHENINRCKHVREQNHLAVHAVITLQPVMASPLAPMSTLLCTRCAIVVAGAIAHAMQAVQEAEVLDAHI